MVCHVQLCSCVSTHSRTKAAASESLDYCFDLTQFQHTAARRRLRDLSITAEQAKDVSTHSRTKAAANSSTKSKDEAVFQHTAARRRLQKRWQMAKSQAMFQHTAARRRLRDYDIKHRQWDSVSTHSRTKAAAKGRQRLRCWRTCVSTHSRTKAAAS